MIENNDYYQEEGTEEAIQGKAMVHQGHQWDKDTKTFTCKQVDGSNQSVLALAAAALKSTSTECK